MRLSSLKVSGYRLFRNEFRIEFTQGLTVLVGENGTGKSAIIDALRLLLLEDEYGRAGISTPDFHKPLTASAADSGAEVIKLACTFDALNEKAQVAYVPWLDINNPERAFLSMTIANRESQRGRFRRDIWGGESASGLFEWELLDAISCVYLPPLRDAESRLGAYRGSRLARLLKNLGEREIQEGEEHNLVKSMKTFNDRLLKDKTISKANSFVRGNVRSALGPVYGQDSMIQFSEARYERIVERLRLLFYPQVPHTGEHIDGRLFRELNENSLGFNNVFYLATVAAELEDLETSGTFLKILLIEEPEAHLHPQLQIQLLNYLKEKSKRSGLQIIMTTHSPTIAAATPLDAIKVLTRENPTTSPTVASLGKCGLSTRSQFYLERWLDITKSTLLFAKSIILVEGIAEALVVPELAQIVLTHRFGASSPDATPQSLEAYGVSIINMGGIYFDHFMQLFKGYEIDPETRQRACCDRIPIRCAGITDCDPEQGSTPTATHPCACQNRLYDLVGELRDHPNCRLFCNSKTLYMLVM